MSEEGGFLNRWSRRKAEARKEPEVVAESGEAGEGDPAAVATLAEAGGDAAAVDLSRLPAIDSIDALTDIKGFLAKGVPESLRNAALRQVWAADPAIRDYIGPYDYAWDFNNPTVHGFGDIAPGTDVASIVRTIMEGHGPTADSLADAAEMVPAAGEPQHLVGEADGDDEPPNSEMTAIAPGEQAVAAIEPPETPENPAPVRRRHGGATPR